MALIEASQFAREAPIVAAEEPSVVLAQLIQERRALASTETQQRMEISKRIKKEVQRNKEEARSEKINTILTGFSNIRHLKVIKSRKRWI